MKTSNHGLDSNVLYKRLISIEALRHTAATVTTVIRDDKSGDIITGITHAVVTIPVNDIITAQIRYVAQGDDGQFLLDENRQAIFKNTTEECAKINLLCMETSYQDLSERASVQAQIVNSQETAYGKMSTAVQIEVDGSTVHLTPEETVALGAWIIHNVPELHSITMMNKNPLPLEVVTVTPDALDPLKEPTAKKKKGTGKRSSKIYEGK